MKLRTKRKIKRIISRVLAVLLMLASLAFAYYKDKLIETSITIILFYVYRHLFEKQWHANSIYACFSVTTIVLIVLINIEVKLSISILFSVILTFIITLISYYVRDYLDNKVLVNTYKKKLESINSKSIENLTEDEMIKLLSSIKYETIHLVYEYLHRDKTTLTASGFAYRNNISEATLYRYVKQVKDKYESLGN